VAEASYRHLASEEELRNQIARNPGRRGLRLLRNVLDLEGGPRRTRSKGERWFLRMLRTHQIEGYEVNEEIHGREVDFLWRGHSFCVELDGWDGHKSRVAFERDRLKWSYLQAKGVDVMPLAVRGAQRDEEGTIRRLRQTLARKG
jgi:very-short-patch-repair endonuclease